LKEFLQQHGISFVSSNFATGFTVDLSSSTAEEKTPVVCLRADIDAIENQDEKEVDYKSQNDGLMHGCGHDVHSSILAGTMIALHRIGQCDNPPPFRVRAIFQPAEESGEGALYCIENGAIKDANSIFGLHVDPMLDCGTVAIRNEFITAICDEINIRIVGKSGHAARPFQCIDPIQAAAQLINAIYINVPRAVDAREGVVITFGQIHGGHSQNVIPNEVRLQGTLRCHHEEQRKLAIENIKRTIDGIAMGCGTEIELDFVKHLPAVNNSDRLLPIARRASIDAVGEENVKWIELPSSGGEDFAYYQQKIDGFMFRLGSSSAAIGKPPLHSSRFDVDPQSIRIGTEIMVKCALYASETE
jgi:amidohydrolase